MSLSQDKATLESAKLRLLFEGLRILIVDDDIDSVDLLAFLLDSYGATIYPSRSASEALEVLSQKDIDLVISDLLMPGEDGYWLIRQLREQKLSIPAIAVTAYISERSFSTALDYGYQCCLSKPIDFSNLITTVAELIKVV